MLFILLESLPVLRVPNIWSQTVCCSVIPACRLHSNSVLLPVRTNTVTASLPPFKIPIQDGVYTLLLLSIVTPMKIPLLHQALSDDMKS